MRFIRALIHRLWLRRLHREIDALEERYMVVAADLYRRNGYR
jgi:hypothetical protein